MAVLGQPGRDARVDLWQLAGQHQQLLDVVALDRTVENRLDLLRRVQMRPVRRECAVLAIAAAGPRQGQREVPAERDATAHAGARFYGARPAAHMLAPLMRRAVLASRRARPGPGRLRHRVSSAPQGQDATPGPRLHAQPDPRRHLQRARADLRRGRGRASARGRPSGQHRLGQAAADRTSRLRRFSTSTTWPSPASATRTSSASWPSSSARWPP